MVMAGKRKVFMKVWQKHKIFGFGHLGEFLIDCFLWELVGMQIVNGVESDWSL